MALNVRIIGHLSALPVEVVRDESILEVGLSVRAVTVLRLNGDTDEM